jgi:hypothetical protein
MRMHLAAAWVAGEVGAMSIKIMTKEAFLAEADEALDEAVSTKKGDEFRLTEGQRWLLSHRGAEQSLKPSK